MVCSPMPVAWAKVLTFQLWMELRSLIHAAHRSTSFRLLAVPFVRLPKKKIGTVVLPVFISEEEDEEKVLGSSPFRDVWKVLRALRAHDDQLADELDQLRLEVGKLRTDGRKIKLPRKIKVDIPRLITRDFAQAFYIRTVNKTTQPPPLTIQQILEWADEHHERTGEWPKQNSGPVRALKGETWGGVEGALFRQTRGLPGGSSIAKLLAEHRESS